jgi:hypothetical protein
MVPSIKNGDIIQVQIEAWRKEIRDGVQFKDENEIDLAMERQLSQIGSDKSCYKICGKVEQFKQIRKTSLEDESYSKVWEALIDCGIPISIIGYKNEEKLLFPPDRIGCLVKCVAPLNGAISFYRGEFFNPIAGKVIDIGKTKHEVPLWAQGKKEFEKIETSGFKLITIDTTILEPISYSVNNIS